jgi:type II restriction enzyme
LIWPVILRQTCDHDTPIARIVARQKSANQVMAETELQRPAFRNLRDVAFRYLLFSDVACNCEAMCRFGEDYRILLKVARGS